MSGESMGVVKSEKVSDRRIKNGDVGQPVQKVKQVVMSEKGIRSTINKKEISVNLPDN